MVANLSKPHGSIFQNFAVYQAEGIAKSSAGPVGGIIRKVRFRPFKAWLFGKNRVMFTVYQSFLQIFWIISMSTQTGMKYDGGCIFEKKIASSYEL